MIKYYTNLNNITEKDLEGFFVGWKAPLTCEQHYQILDNSSYIVLAYDTTEKRVVGFVNALSDEVNFAFIPMIEVLPEFQNKGIGTELFKRVLKQLDGISSIDLTCDLKLQDFYKRFDMMKSNGMIIRKYLET